MTISCRVEDIFDSAKLQTSPNIKSVDDKTATSTSVEDNLPIIWATAPVSAPIICSPKTLAVLRDKPDGNTNLSRVGDDESKDSYTPIIFTASGLFKDISLSSTLKP